MFDWLRRIFGRSDARQEFYDTVDSLIAHDAGGLPITTERLLGTLNLRSETLVIGDPQYVPDLEISNIDSHEATISAHLWQYPSGLKQVKSLKLRLGGTVDGTSSRKIGEIGIDSAKLVVVDKADIEEHWTQVGKDRIGIIITASSDTVLRMLTKRFKLKTVRMSPLRAEIVGPVSEQLENEIKDYLRSFPKYADYPFMYFYVQTNNSFDRVNYMTKAWDFIPVGNAAAPLMFVCGTGRGDGVYEVQCEFSGDIPRVLSITFIDN